MLPEFESQAHADEAAEERARQGELFERPFTTVLDQLTDQEATMLGIGMLLYLQMRRDARENPNPETRYDLSLARLANDLYVRAMRRF